LKATNGFIIPGSDKLILGGCYRKLGQNCVIGVKVGHDPTCTERCTIGPLQELLKGKPESEWLKSRVLVSGRLATIGTVGERRPLANFEVRIEMPSGREITSRTDANGSFEIVLAPLGAEVSSIENMDIGELDFDPMFGTTHEQNWFHLVVARAPAT
jgi:hypothetical protein